VKLREETELEALNSALVGVVQETMQPAYDSLWLRSAPEPKGKRAEPHSSFDGSRRIGM
jgi:hypothetical protein